MWKKEISEVYNAKMDIIQKLTETFLKFPGIGPRQAKRFAFFLANSEDKYLKELTKLIS